MTTALITGANRGIGLSLCRLLAGRGVQVIAACRQPSDALGSLGVRIVRGVELTSDEAVAGLAQELSDQAIDLMVLNAGILRRETLEDLDFERIREQLEVNALGPLRVVKALLPRLAPGAKIALITSRMGSIGDNTSGGAYGYRMSKAALNMAGVSLAHDLKNRGIAVGIFHPGYVRTDMTRQSGDIDPDTAAEQLLARIDELSLERSGRFLHARGEPLPW